jgi:hypothetical protein
LAAARSLSSATVIACASTSQTAKWTCSPARANWQRVVPHGAHVRRRGGRIQPRRRAGQQSRH